MNKLELAEQIYLDQIAGPEMMDTQLALKASYAVIASEVFYETWVKLRGPDQADRITLVGCKACYGSGGKKTEPCKICKGAGKVPREA